MSRRRAAAVHAAVSSNRYIQRPRGASEADAPVRVIKAQAGNVHLESYCSKSDEKGAIGEISKGAA